MIRFLDNLVLLKELDTIDGIECNSRLIREKHPDKIVVIRRASYVYRDVLCEEAQKRVTQLDEYIQLGELAEKTSIRKELFLERIYFMQKNNSSLFEYISIGNIFFLKIDEEFKYLMQNYQPFYANLRSRNLVKVKLLGDLKIGFY